MLLPESDPDLVGRAGVGTVAESLASERAGRQPPGFSDSGQDVGDRDLVGLPVEDEAPTRPPDGPDEACLFQLEEDLLQELGGYLLLGRD